MLRVARDEIIRSLPGGVSVSKETLSGHGHSAFVDCVVARPRTLDEARSVLAACAARGYSVTPKGSGCSFGDNITNGQGVVLDMCGWNEIVDFEATTGRLTAQGGTSAGRILHRTLPTHWILRALPGTSFGTMAGFIANNVHGKDGFRHGNFGNGVVSMRMLLANGDVITVSRDEHPDIFHGVIGGMGLLGVVIETTLQMLPIAGSIVETQRQYFSTIPEAFRLFDALPPDVDMAMVWFDGFHKTGRGILETAKWLPEDPSPQPPSMEFITKKFMGRLPIGLVYPLVKPFASRATMAAANAAAILGSKLSAHTSRLHLYNYYYPHMLSIPDSPKALKGGLIGFHILVPEERACDFVAKMLDLGRAHKCESWFAGIKRFKDDPFVMSFAGNGYAVTIEMPGRFARMKKFQAFFDAMIAMTLDYQGRMCIGKDAHLRPGDVKAMYPRWAEFQALRHLCDPNRLFASDLSRRLDL